MAVAMIVVVMMPVCADLLDRHDAAVGYFALAVLELNCGVMNAEILAERAIDLLQDARAL